MFVDVFLLYLAVPRSSGGLLLVMMLEFYYLLWFHGSLAFHSAIGIVLLIRDFSRSAAQ